METNLSQATTAYCVECGGKFSTDEMIRHGAAYVCAKCKPVFMQKLAEGAQIRSNNLQYAGFWIRFGAIFLDGIVLWVANMILTLVFLRVSVAQAVGARPSGSPLWSLVLFGIQLAVGMSYETIMIAKYGATLGKMACHLKVVTADGGPVSYPRALGRYFAKVLNIFTLTIGYIIAAFDSEKRGLHDRICGTRVIIAR